MRTKNLAEMTEALARISAAQIGNHVSGDVVARAIHAPGTTSGQRFGVPAVVIAALDGLFGRLPWGEARSIAVALPEAIGQPGKDLRRVVWRLLLQETYALEAYAAPLAKKLFYERLCRELRNGLADACRGCPWPNALDTLDELPRTMPPPSGFTKTELLAQLEHEIRTALRSTIGALIMADQAVVAILRRRSAAAVDRDDILRIGGRSEERVSQLATAALRAVAQAGAVRTALLEPDSVAKGQVADTAQRADFRRQGAALLQLVRQA